MKIPAVTGFAFVAAAILTGCVSDNRPMTASDNFMGTGATAPMASGTAQATSTSKAVKIDVVKSPQ